MTRPSRSTGRLNNKSPTPYTKKTAEVQSKTVISQLTSSVAQTRLSGCQILSSLNFTPSQLVRLLKQNDLGQRLVDLLLDPDTSVSQAATETLLSFTSSKDPNVCQTFFQYNLLTIIQSLLNTSQDPPALLLDVLGNLSSSPSVASALASSDLLSALLMITSNDPSFSRYSSHTHAAWQCLLSIVESSDLSSLSSSPHFLPSLTALSTCSDLSTLAQGSLFCSSLLLVLVNSTPIDESLCQRILEVFSHVIEILSKISLDDVSTSFISLFNEYKEFSSNESKFNEFESKLSMLIDQTSSITDIIQCFSIIFDEPADENPEATQFVVQCCPKIETILSVLVKFIQPIWNISQHFNNLNDLESEVPPVLSSLLAIVQVTCLTLASLLVGVPSEELTSINPQSLFDPLMTLILSSNSDYMIKIRGMVNVGESVTSLMALIVKLAEVVVDIDQLIALIDLGSRNISTVITVDLLSIIGLIITRSAGLSDLDDVTRSKIRDFFHQFITSSTPSIASEALVHMTAIFKLSETIPSLRFLVSVKEFSNIVHNGSLSKLLKSRQVKMNLGDRESCMSAISEAKEVLASFIQY
ncbi:hypothetical protein GEMRC1_004344 [Eukaryota sp. GEM-RC1]